MVVVIVCQLYVQLKAKCRIFYIRAIIFLNFPCSVDCSCRIYLNQGYIIQVDDLHDEVDELLLYEISVKASNESYSLKYHVKVIFCQLY